MALNICNGCGSAYAVGLPQCPHCARTDFTPDSTEPQPVPDHQPPPAPPPVSALKAEHVAYVAEVVGVPEEEAAALTKPELVELARTAAEGSDDTSAGISSLTSSSSERPSSTGSPATLPSAAPTTDSP